MEEGDKEQWFAAAPSVKVQEMEYYEILRMQEIVVSRLKEEQNRSIERSIVLNYFVTFDGRNPDILLLSSSKLITSTSPT